MPSSTTVLSYAERAQLFAQLGALEQAGVSVERALAIVQLRPQMQPRVSVMLRHLQQGRDVARAGQLAGLFSPLEVTLLQAAQRAGSPARLYQRLADGYAQRAEQAKVLRARLLLPAAVLLLALLVQPLPSLVAGDLSLGGYVWGVLKPLLVFGGLWCVVRHLIQRAEQPAAAHASLMDEGLLRLPLLGALYVRCNLRNYSESLGLMLESGMSMFDALPKATATLSSNSLRRDFITLQQRVLTGASLAAALQSLDVPDKAQLVGLVHTGEASGTLPGALLGYANRQNQALASFQTQFATWVPRLAYALVALWMAYGLLAGASVFTPALPM